MEDGSHTSKQTFSSSKGIDGAPCCLEHAVVEDTLMSHCNMMQTLRHSEYDMEVLSRDDLFPAECDPLLTFLVLALGAMTIPAAVIADADIPTFGTNLYMPAKGTGPALGYVGKGSFNRRYNMMLAKKLSSMMRGTGMTERMNCERMVETCLHKRILKDSADISRFDGLRSNPSSVALEHEVITWKSFLKDTKECK